MVLVVSPLNSLITDQISVGLKACKLESVECITMQAFIQTNVAFVSPEYLMELVNKQFLHKISDRIIGVVVDESHCVVNW